MLDRRRGQHWWLPSSRAVVLGLGLAHRAESIVDVDRCEREGVAILHRKAGGGAVLLEPDNMLCGAIALPTETVSTDVTESYRWLGNTLATVLSSLGVAVQRVEVEEARADLAALRAASSPLLNTCYGALSPHELTVDGRKLVGLAQIRRRETTLYVLGILLRSQSPLADLLLDGSGIRDELSRRTVGLEALTSRSASEVAAAIADAMPSVP